MDFFEETLSSLLLQNDCVVIPAFGGFVASTISARIEPASGVITPPRKALRFNKSLIDNDGLLVNAIARKKNISYEEAYQRVKTDTQKIQRQLNSGERVLFQNVGYLYKNNNGKVAFEQDRFFNLLLSSYGMANIQFIPAEEQVESAPEKEHAPREKELHPAPAAVEQPETNNAHTNADVMEHPATKKERNTLKKVVRIAAVAALIPIAFYSFWIPMKTDVLQSGVIYTSDFNPFQDNVSALYKRNTNNVKIEKDTVKKEASLQSITAHLQPNSGDVFSYPIDKDRFIPVRFNPKSGTGASGTPEKSKGSYHIIVGSFEQRSNAEAMIKKLNTAGYNGQIVDVHNGLHRVSAAQKNTKEAILQALNRLQVKGWSSWVLKQ
ncbi:MAG: SPOR domain-containing protein [Bacteroidota bacterium]